MNELKINGCLIRTVREEDANGWLRLWQQYCEFYKVDVHADITRGTWERLLDPSHQIYCLLALNKADQVVGFANYVLHPCTWDLHSACYLEDLFVESTLRGRGIGKQLIDNLLERCAENGWARMYWHTQEHNSRARRLYDQFCQRDDRVRYTIYL
jgi:GNAT superfamily N-acetyltransferase